MEWGAISNKEQSKVVNMCIKEVMIIIFLVYRILKHGGTFWPSNFNPRHLHERNFHRKTSTRTSFIHKQLKTGNKPDFYQQENWLKIVIKSIVKVKYFSTIKTDKSLIHATTAQMIWSKGNQTQKDYIFYDFIYVKL